jgi:spermidine synthase
MKTLLRKIGSYFVPVVVETRKGAITDTLEVRLYNGRYTLDASKVNYSFGCLHEVFERAFESIHLGSYNFKNVLILGMGAGSVMSILTKTYKITCPVTAVEKDIAVIDLGNKYFNMSRYTNLKLINSDACEFMKQSIERFDLVVIDLFVEDQVPEIFASESFLGFLRNRASANSIVIYNQVTNTPRQKQEADILFQSFSEFFPGSYKLLLVDYYGENTLIISNTAQIADTLAVEGSFNQNLSLTIGGVS